MPNIVKVNTAGKDVSIVDRAYLAGFLDADGAIMAVIERHHEKRYGYRVRVCVKISQKTRLILDLFQSKLQIGHVKRNRTTYDWEIRDQVHVQQFITLLLPYLHVKKPQAIRALKIGSMRIKRFEDLKRRARSADALAKLNVRSKNRRKNFAMHLETPPVTTDSLSLPVSWR